MDWFDVMFCVYSKNYNGRKVAKFLVGLLLEVNEVLYFCMFVLRIDPCDSKCF